MSNMKKQLEKNEEEFIIVGEEENKEEGRTLVMEKITDDSESEGSNICYEYIPKRSMITGFIDWSMVRNNYSKMNKNKIAFTTGISIAASVSPILVRKLRDKSGFNGITQEEIWNLGFSILPSLFRVTNELTKGTGTANRVSKTLYQASLWLSLRGTIKSIINNIRKNGGDKLSLSDPDIWLNSLSFISNSFVIPTIGNPSVVKRSLYIAKVVAGRTIGDKVEHYINDKVLKDVDIKIKSEDIFDIAATGLDMAADGLKKSGLLGEDDDEDSLSGAIADRTLSLINNTLIPKTQKKGHSMLGSASVGRNRVF